MKRILLSEAGGTLTRNVVMSLRAAPEKFHIVGVSSNPYELKLARCDETYLVPGARDPAFVPVLSTVAAKTRVTLIHSQHDTVIAVLSARRGELPAPLFLPSESTVAACIDKYESYRRWAAAGIPVPETMEIGSPADLTAAFAKLGPTVWFRLKEGGGGAGSLPTDDPEFARIWIDHFEGWGKFTAARLLSPQSVTWTSIWQNGRLVVAQGRKRLTWLFGNRTLSGVTGVTGVGLTVSDPAVDDLARRAIVAIDPSPHGIFSVDMTYAPDGTLCPTEINIGRFFTTVHFFTAAGVNFPYIFVKLALGETPPVVDPPVNPLPPGKLWIRGMDTEPVLTDENDINIYRNDLKQLITDLPVNR
jgi:hypothetical protein